MKQATTAALIQLLESIVITAIISGIVAASTTLQGNGKVNWQITGGTFAIAFVFSLAHGLTAYIKTLPAPNNVSMDDLSTTLDNFIAQIQQRIQTPQNSVRTAVGPTPIMLGSTAQQATNVQATVSQQPQAIHPLASGATTTNALAGLPATVYDTLSSVPIVQPQAKQ